ncbi:hypothetical protein Y1Q_0012780 [Alligator mississippiensis]|uniref:Uncharacterized protein n=1 Tax=Alligator mississippiensis TaxID=8496 RepID=A0A151M1A0_ALLMI|nr:hypothetical protein Y1Q_0012780 [Alligator mississippiensis]
MEVTTDSKGEGLFLLPFSPTEQQERGEALRGCDLTYSAAASFLFPSASYIRTALPLHSKSSVWIAGRLGT